MQPTVDTIVQPYPDFVKVAVENPPPPPPDTDPIQPPLAPPPPELAPPAPEIKSPWDALEPATLHAPPKVTFMPPPDFACPMPRAAPSDDALMIALTAFALGVSVTVLLSLAFSKKSVE